MSAEPRSIALVDCPVLYEGAILARERGENFPVALRILPRELREDLRALYGFARLVDQIGDQAPGDRMALLDEVAEDLTRAYAGAAQHPLLRRLAATLARQSLPRAPFERLIEANRLDQRLSRIETWEELLGYCALSANPVGELVLHLIGRADAGRVRHSDAVCTALQVVEHCQDVAEDFQRGRVYLPAKDLAEAGCLEADLARAPASRALRRVVALQIARARALLAEAPALLRGLSGRPRWMLAAFAAGGLATCDAFATAGYDPNAKLVRGRRSDLLRHILALASAWGGENGR